MLSEAEKLSVTEKSPHIAVFGSAFNPPTLGHKSVIERLLHFDKVLLLPSIAHAWGKEMLDFSVRCELVELFITDIGSDKLELCTIEQALYLPEKSVTTYDVLNHLETIYPDDQITFVIGPDNFAHFTRFYKHDEILKRWSLMVCPETVPVRSSLIRENLKKAHAIDSMTTPSVAQFVSKNNLFVAD